MFKHQKLLTDFKTCHGGRADIVFIIDSSTSVGQANFNKMLDFMKGFITVASVDSGRFRYGIVVYNTDVTTKLNLNAITRNSELLDYIDGISYTYGNTNVWSALHVTRTEMFEQDADRDDVENIAILLTDGISNLNNQRSIPESKMLKNAGTEIYGIGIGLSEMGEINGISSQPLDQYRYSAEDFEDLSAAKSQILSKLCRGIHCTALFMLNNNIKHVHVLVLLDIFLRF